jgi:hypothetical protein
MSVVSMMALIKSDVRGVHDGIHDYDVCDGLDDRGVYSVHDGIADCDVHDGLDDWDARVSMITVISLTAYQ